MSFYNHEDEEDNNPFLDANKPLGGFDLSMILPAGDTIKVGGKRGLDTIITVSKSSENSPLRDAALLEVVLSTSLEEKTLLLLAELLYTRHLLPFIKGDSFGFKPPTINDQVENVKKKRTKKPPTPEDEE